MSCNASSHLYIISFEGTNITFIRSYFQRRTTMRTSLLHKIPSYHAYIYSRLKLETRLSKWTQRHKFSYSVQKKTLMFKRKRLQDYCNIFRANPIFTIGCTYDKTFSVLSYVESIVIMGIARKMQQQSQRLFLLAIQVFFHVEK